MRHTQPVRLSVGVLLITVLWASPTVRAQSAVGSGPLTATLPDVEPTTGVLSSGRLKLAPSLTVRELGWDDNVFNEAATEAPEEDWVVSAQPDLLLYTRLRFVRLAAYAGSELNYFRTHEDERSVGHALRGRADFLLSRVRPFLGGARIKTRTRPNGEIDVRANRLEEEASGGLALDVTPQAVVYAAASKSGVTFQDAFQDGINLSDTLSRDAFNYQAGFKVGLTPLLSMQLYGSYQDDKFRTAAIRNARIKAGTVTFRLAPDAVVAGEVTVTYHDSQFADPLLEPLRGVIGSATLTYPVLELGRLSVAFRRGVGYSFDAAEAYYLGNSGTMTYTQRLVGEVDLQGTVSRSLFDYAARAGEPQHVDTVDTAGGSLGYNLRNRTRLALHYEYARRRSPVFPPRNYQRRRVFLSWSVAL